MERCGDGRGIMERCDDGREIMERCGKNVVVMVVWFY